MCQFRFCDQSPEVLCTFFYENKEIKIKHWHLNQGQDICKNCPIIIIYKKKSKCVRSKILRETWEYCRNRDEPVLVIQYANTRKKIVV